MTEECITTPHFYKPPNHQTRQSVHAAGGSRPGVFKGDRDTLSRKKSGQTSPAGPRNGMPAATWALSETTPGSEHGLACTLFSQGLRKQAGEPQGLTEFFLAFSFLIRVAVNIQNIKKFLGAQPSLFSYCERALYVDCGRFVLGLGQSLSPAPEALPSGHTHAAFTKGRRSGTKAHGMFHVVSKQSQQHPRAHSSVDGINGCGAERAVSTASNHQRGKIKRQMRRNTSPRAGNNSSKQTQQSPAGRLVYRSLRTIFKTDSMSSGWDLLD